LGLRDREVQRKRRNLVRGALLAQQLVADLWPVPVCDRELFAEEGTQGRGRNAQVRALLRSGSALARPHQRVAAERDDRCHTSAGGCIKPASVSTVSRVGSPISCSR